MHSLSRVNRKLILERAILKHRYRLIELTKQANELLQLKREMEAEAIANEGPQFEIEDKN